MKEIYIRDEFIRLDAALKFSGAIGTGGQAKMVIQDGLVLVKGIAKLGNLGYSAMAQQGACEVDGVGEAVHVILIILSRLLPRYRIEQVGED